MYDEETDDEPASQDAVPVEHVEPALTEKGKRRKEHYEEARRLHAEGWTNSAIGKHPGIGRHTVAHYVQAEAFPDHRHGSQLDPFKPYLLRRWKRVSYGNAALQGDLPARLSGRTLYRIRLRHAPAPSAGVPKRSRMMSASNAACVDEEACKLTPRQAAALVLRREDKRSAEDEKKIERLREADVEIKHAIGLAQEFASLLRERRREQLDGWLARAAGSGLAPFRRFAKSLKRDYAAVRAALEMPWSTGPVEGHINKLKMIERQMYGKAKLDLLGQRMVYVA